MSEKVAVVTGAGSGIGREVAIGLSSAGFSVALAGRRIEALEETAALCSGSQRTSVIPTDIAKAAEVEHLFDAVRQTYGRLDLLFNNAGTGAPPVPLEELSLDGWRTVVDVNLTGAFLCLQQAFRLMKSQDPRGGRIINNGSISAHTPRPFSIAYTATKHAITGLTKSAALDGRPYGIACGQIDIGNAATPMTKRMSKGVQQADGAIAPEEVMPVEHVVQAVLMMAALPPTSNVLNMTIMATTMPFIGRG